MPIKIIKNDINDKSSNKRQGCPKKGRLMGLDLGSKTIGVSISDAEQGIATPITTIERKKLSKDLQQLGDIVAEYEIRACVIGWPLNMDGSEGARCDATRSFAHELRQAKDLFGQDPWIGLWDERLSTRTVDEFVDGRVDMPKMAKRGAKDSGLTDKLAAQHILQSFLDGV
ncbi:MAG: Holliday junction resolvase RuvX [Micavibrio sp.]|nr:Holliday junction resolvase RuvX [Micavibrio sp.]